MMKRGKTFSVFAALTLLHGCGDAEDRTANMANRTDTVQTTPIANVAEKDASAPVPSAKVRSTVSPRSKPAPSEPNAVPSADYRALGTEPFWSIIVKGSQATLTRPDHASLTFAVRYRDDGPARQRLQGDGLSMAISPGPCSDGMSDAVYADRVQVAFAQGTLKGCGGERYEPREEGYDEPALH